MKERRFSLGVIFLSGWIVFFGSAIFHAILRVNHSNISGLNLNSLYYTIDIMPYLGLLLVILPTILFLKDTLKKTNN